MKTMNKVSNRNKILCFSGHRTEKLPKNKKKFTDLLQNVSMKIDKAISEGYYTFIFDVCYGFDLICAEQVLLRKQIIQYSNPVHIKLIVAVPFEEQASKWKQQNRDMYFNILSKCDDVIILNKHFKTGCYHERNRFMVGKSSKLICYYDGSGGGTGYTVEYAKKRSVQVVNLCTSVTSHFNYADIDRIFDEPAELFLAD